MFFDEFYHDVNQLIFFANFIGFDSPWFSLHNDANQIDSNPSQTSNDIIAGNGRFSKSLCDYHVERLFLWGFNYNL